MKMEQRRNKNTLEAIDREVDIEENIVTVPWIMSFVQPSISFDDTSCNYDSLLEPQVKEEQIRWNEWFLINLLLNCLNYIC